MCDVRIKILLVRCTTELTESYLSVYKNVYRNSFVGCDVCLFLIKMKNGLNTPKKWFYEKETDNITVCFIIF